jgi:hypothetical protein
MFAGQALDDTARTVAPAVVQILETLGRHNGALRRPAGA